MKEKQDRERERERRRKAEKLNAEMHLGRRHQPPQFIYIKRGQWMLIDKKCAIFLLVLLMVMMMMIIIIVVLEEDRGMGEYGRVRVDRSVGRSVDQAGSIWPLTSGAPSFVVYIRPYSITTR
ncbi:hypothetical protein T11_10596 [Trichinella zimbabwensis]|uniref:Uncharacterized protein n=1 Tax=Trichinella zimbabwensis TaxID=268475 RepID=A0A0V1GWB9_9BILA|nr:hypothetical protein T11_10596 [Trichinella zimbabwensis]